MAAAGHPNHSSSSPVQQYMGIRCRSGKWVSEIREPRKTTRIWLGTYATPEMAAAAYDVAALALKGPDTRINLPALAPSYPRPASLSAPDIRAAAANAASTLAPRTTTVNQIEAHAPPPEAAHEFVDEEALFGLPRLLADMAEGMLVSPPTADEEEEYSPENYSGYDSLWSYP
ncbi:hypothetical protein ACS0TY_004507 [Phlomoides rotata]